MKTKSKRTNISCHNFKRNEKKPRDSSDEIKHIHNFQVWFEPQFYIQLVYKAPLYLIFRKNMSFLLSLINFLVQTLQYFKKCFKNIFDLKKLKKHPQTLLRNTHFFALLPWAAQKAKTEELMFQNVSYRPTVYKTGVWSHKTTNWKWFISIWQDQTIFKSNEYNMLWASAHSFSCNCFKFSPISQAVVLGLNFNGFPLWHLKEVHRGS